MLTSFSLLNIFVVKNFKIKIFNYFLISYLISYLKNYYKKYFLYIKSEFLNYIIMISRTSYIENLYFSRNSQLIYQLTNLFQVFHCGIKFMGIQRPHFINCLNFWSFLPHFDKLFLTKVILLWFFLNFTPIITKFSH